MLKATEVSEKNVASSRRFSLNHPGIDLLDPKGTKIKARHAGKLIKNGTNPPGQDFGNYCIVAYTGVNFQGWSAHLSKFLVKAGSAVKKGQVIALSGNSGYVLPKPTWYNPSSGSHLHYAESTKGTARWVNPDKTVGPKPPKPPVKAVYYIVKSGDTLMKIASKYGTTWLNLQRLNKAKYPTLVQKPSLIQIGWRLRVR